MTLLSLELRLVVWLMLAWLVLVLVVWAARYAPFLLWLPVWGRRRRWRRWWLRRRLEAGDLA